MRLCCYARASKVDTISSKAFSMTFVYALTVETQLVCPLEQAVRKGSGVCYGIFGFPPATTGYQRGETHQHGKDQG